MIKGKHERALDAISEILARIQELQDVERRLQELEPRASNKKARLQIEMVRSLVAQAACDLTLAVLAIEEERDGLGP